MLRAGTAAGASPTSYDAVKNEYDAMGRVSRQSNPYTGDVNGNGSPAFWTSNTYDSQSRVTTVTLPDTQTIQTGYNGAIVTVTDQVNRKRQSQVDGLGRLISVTEQDPATGALSLATTYSYDTLDNLTGVNQGGQTRSFAYDSLGRMTSQNTPEGGAMSCAYTDFGAVLKRTDARNVETHYHYDALNRPNQVWYTGVGGLDDPNASRPGLPTGVAATSDVTIVYKTASPGNGAVDTITDGAGTESYVYDSLGRATSKTRTIDGNAYQTQYQYNQANQLTLMIYPSGKRVRMNFDSRGRMIGEDKVDTTGNVLTSYVSGIGYNVAGQVTSMTSGSGVIESYTYSASRLQLTRQTAVKGATTLMDLNYSYAAAAGASGVGTTAGNSGQLIAIGNNPSGQPSSINGQARNQSFSYDDLGRLVNASSWGISQRSYSYDRWGNRTTMSDSILGSSQSISLQQQTGSPAGVPNNRMATVNGVGYSYDPSGNLTYDGAHTYQYDGEGRIASVDSTGASYSYDSANRRVKKIVGSTTTYYVWEGAQVIAEYSNVPAGAGGTSYYLADRLSTRMITDSSGALKGTQDHLPFGEDAGTTGTSEKHRFTSYERDSESGSDYAVNRQHQFATGRFMQADVVAGSIGNPQSLNRYEYSLNDPVDSADPTGLTPSLYDPYSWTTDASVHGPGLYIDGSQVLAGQESLFWSVLSMGAGVIANIGSKAYLGKGGATFVTVPSRYEYAYQRGPGVFNISVTLTQTYQVSEASDLLVLVGFQQRSDRDTKADVEWARSAMRDGMPFPPGRTDNIGNVLDCYNKWKFSSTIAGLVGEQFRGIAEAFEIGAPASAGGDILAMIRKAQRVGIGGSMDPGASGMNAVFRAIGKTLGLPTSVRKGLTGFGNKATPSLRYVGVAVAGYNASIFGQCLFGYLK